MKRVVITGIGVVCCLGKRFDRRVFLMYFVRQVLQFKNYLNMSEGTLHPQHYFGPAT